MKPLVSIVVPMFNEEENAPTTLKAVADALSAEGWTYELHPVSDGSTDKTAEVLAALRYSGRSQIRQVLLRWPPIDSAARRISSFTSSSSDTSQAV